MELSNYIVNDISIQPITTGIGHLKEMFNELTYSHIPIEKDGIFQGSVSENDLRCFESSQTLADYQYSLLPFFTRPKVSWLDILKSFSSNETNVMPVLQEGTNEYLGYLELSDILNYFNNMPFLKEAGTVIVVECAFDDFSISQIGQIVESNEGKLFGAIMSEMKGDMAQITLKIGLTSVNEIIQTFRRYGYKIVSAHQEDTFLKNLKERSDYLNKYLNI